MGSNNYLKPRSHSSSSTAIPSNLSTFTLQFTLIIGWLFGCIPSGKPPTSLKRIQSQSSSSLQSQGQSSRGFRCCYKNITYYVAAFLILLNILGLVEYFNKINSMFSIRKVSLSDTVIYCVFDAYSVISDVARRILLLWQKSKVLSLLLATYELEDALHIKGAGSKNKLLVYLTLLNVVFGLSTRCGQLVSLINNLEMPEVLKSFPDFTSGVIFYILYIASDASSNLVVKGLTILVGKKLASTYESELTEFVSLWKDQEQITAVAGKEESSMVPSIKILAKEGSTLSIKELEKVQIARCDESKRRFKLLQHCFKLYNDVIGGQILLSVTQGILMIVAYLFKIVETGREDMDLSDLWHYLSGTMEEVVNLWLIGHVGEVVKRAMAARKEQLKALQVEAPWGGGTLNGDILLGNAPDNKTLLGNYMLNWKWKLDAAGLFDIDHSIFPAIAGSMLTLVMFMFQLKLTEETSGLTNLSAAAAAGHRNST